MAALSADQLASVLQDWTLDGGPETCTSPKRSEKRALVTSALPYVNNVPHLGNIIGSLLSADVFARFCRLRGRETLFICGTDEYGTATETKALEEGVSPEEICSKYHRLHAQIYEWFNLSFDKFGRTCTPEQTELCQAIFWKLHANNLILEETVEQLFCESCKRFLADRFVEGTCPFCSFADARGDQCDKCGKLINAPDLVAARCKLCRSAPQLRSSKHLFLDLPQLEAAVSQWMDATLADASCCWTQTARVIAASWLKEGLKPRCITRDLKWGTPVPLPGYEDKVFYVWFDAPIGYLSITKCCVGDDWDKWWKRPDEVELFQFMAKDNVPFHAIIMPATQLGTGDAFTLVNGLVAVEYLNYEEQKFSKSRGVGVFGNDAMNTGIPADIWRFYLISIRPESADSSFSWTDLMTKNNSELLNNLGNFCNRSLTFLFKNFGATVQDVFLVDRDQQLVAAVNQELSLHLELMSKAKLRDGLRQLMKISALGNLYLQDTKPWELVRVAASTADRARAGSVISLSANLAALLSILFSPFLPETCAKLRHYLNFTDETFETNRMIPLLQSGHRINEVRGCRAFVLDLKRASLPFLQPLPLFRKVEESEISRLKSRFAGHANEQEDSGVPSGCSAQQLEQLVADQGNKVRALKAEKADKSVVMKEVEVLKKLKASQAKLASAASSQPITCKSGGKGDGGGAVHHPKADHH